MKLKCVCVFILAVLQLFWNDKQAYLKEVGFIYMLDEPFFLLFILLVAMAIWGIILWVPSCVMGYAARMFKKRFSIAFNVTFAVIFFINFFHFVYALIF